MIEEFLDGTEPIPELLLKELDVFNVETVSRALDQADPESEVTLIVQGEDGVKRVFSVGAVYYSKEGVVLLSGPTNQHLLN